MNYPAYNPEDTQKATPPGIYWKVPQTENPLPVALLRELTPDPIGTPPVNLVEGEIQDPRGQLIRARRAQLKPRNLMAFAGSVTGKGRVGSDTDRAATEDHINKLRDEWQEREALWRS